MPRRSRLNEVLLVAGGLLAPLAALAGSGSSATGIYTCVDTQGRRHTSDRPILECLDREQRVLNRDGSTRQLIGPSMTAEERAAAEARERQRQAERTQQLEAGRRDRMLLTRYPAEPDHQKARETALSVVRDSIRNSEQRITELARERQPLLSESEFYRGKPLPPKLRQALEFNDVATEAHKSLIENQQAELERINALFDRELLRLRPLWAGAKPGAAGAEAATAAQVRK
ncbi:DUF4124 domain-containing protein [Caldimonas tepidiphila]|uniref:DUF4124 domain-containing protein n=1 Tax=Caldimonas tepidiphila TaxID=2315841 RepID=UPI000E5AD14B|nr:DUF4124 domain-containing protein [Caldimonas tepidiphila]